LLVVAYPRVLGHVFNPVSWWYAFHPDGRLGMVIAEVRNTFGDWRAYLLDDLEVQQGQHELRVRARAVKDFHVSPFLPVEGLSYDFTFRVPPMDVPVGARVVEHMVVSDGDGMVLDATQSQVARPLTTARLWGAMLRRPLITLWTIALIHRQALRLWWRRTPFHRRPAPPHRPGSRHSTPPAPNRHQPRPCHARRSPRDHATRHGLRPPLPRLRHVHAGQPDRWSAPAGASRRPLARLR
jgi:uncharacterized protein